MRRGCALRDLSTRGDWLTQMPSVYCLPSMYWRTQNSVCGTKDVQAYAMDSLPLECVLNQQSNDFHSLQRYPSTSITEPEVYILTIFHLQVTLLSFYYTTYSLVCLLLYISALLLCALNLSFLLTNLVDLSMNSSAASTSAASGICITSPLRSSSSLSVKSIC